MRCPYKGLLPFSEEDHEFFAGRAKEIELIISNLYASPLTILYGESGVGKTSLIVAGVLPELEKEEYRVVAILFREWQSPDFEFRLRQEILKSLLKTINRLRKQGGPQAPALSFDSFLETFRLGLKLESLDQLYALRLDEFIKECCQAFYGRLFFVFDQFEEYIYYHPLTEDGKRFDDQLAAAINDRSVPAGFLISLREDGLGKLDRLRGGIPDLLGNVIRLEHLDKSGAEEAIRKPLRIFNRDSPVKVEATDDFTEALLSQADADRLEFDEPVDSTEEPSRSDRGIRYRALALQAVLTRLWDGYVAPKLERSHGSNGTIQISRAALKQVAHRRGKNGSKGESEDEVRCIVRTYFDERLMHLDKESQRYAAEILPHMVRAGGQKKAQLVKTLARVSGIPEEHVQATLDKLRAEPLNLVKEVPSKGGSLYELHHDVMAFAVQDWSVRKQREIRERRQRLIWCSTVLGLLIVSLSAGFSLWNHFSRQQMEMREHIALADKQLARIINYIGISGDPLTAKAGLLAAIDLYAWSKKKHIPVSEGILIALYLAPERQGEPVALTPEKALERQFEIWKTIPALTAPGGKYTLMIEANNTPVLFARDKRKLQSLSTSLKTPIVEIGFSAKAERVGVLCADGSVFVWDTRNSALGSARSEPSLTKALDLESTDEESRNKLLKPAPHGQPWQLGYSALGQQWLLKALGAVTASHRDFKDGYKLADDEDKTLTETLNEAIELAETNKLEEALASLSDALGKIEVKVDQEALKDVLASSSFLRVMDALRAPPKIGAEQTSGGADLPPRFEQLAVVLKPSIKNKVEAQKEIRRGNLLASQGDKEGAKEAYRKAIELDSELVTILSPEEQVKSFGGTIERDQKIALGNEAAQRGEVEKAIAFYREAIALDPQIARSLDPEAEARKWSERQSGSNVSPPGQASQESTQIKE